MALLATQRATPTGLAIAVFTADAHEFTPGQNSFLWIINNSAAAVTVTIPTPAKAYDVDVADIAVSVPAATTRLVAAPPRLVRKSNGRADVTFSDPASVLVAVVEIP